MVQLMNSGMESLTKKRVKLEAEAEEDDQLGPLHKRSKPDSDSDTEASLQFQQWNSVGYKNPLDEPSPLGLRLKKSPSLLDLIQMRLSQEKSSSKLEAILPQPQPQPKKDHKATTNNDNKLKASNFPGSLLRIGTWEYKSRYEGDLVAKCYFAKHKLVWEVLDGSLKNKIEIQWSDITAIKANYPDDGPGTLDVVLARRPLFFRETNPQPRKHTLWQATPDFTGGQASIYRRHFLQCPLGMLGKHFEKLIQCDPRLNFVSQQPEIVLECPYFEPRVAMPDDPNVSSHVFDLKSEETHAFLGLEDVASPSGAQSSSSKNEQDFVGGTPEIFSQETPSPSSGNLHMHPMSLEQLHHPPPCFTRRRRCHLNFISLAVMDSHAIVEIRSSGDMSSKLLSHLDQIKVPGLHPSMSMSDLVSHIGHCISEQITPDNPIFPGGRDILEEITQYLFSDSQLTSAFDEQPLMSRVNSLCCLLQKDPSTAQNLQAESDDNVDVNRDQKVGHVSASANERKVGERSATPEGELNDVSGCKQAPSMSRKDSLGELLLNLPRIASLPQFLFNLPEDSDNQAR